MGKAPKQGTTGSATAPKEFAATTPPGTSAMLDHSFTLQAVMELKKEVGVLGGKIDAVDKRISDIARDVSWHGKWIYAATVVAVLLVGILGFIAKILWDVAKAKLGI